MISYLILIALGLVVLTWFIVGNILSPAYNAGATIPTSNANKTGVDFDSEDEGLFGKEQKSSGLFDRSKQPSKPVENTKSSLSREASTLPSAAPSNPLGVENVRAMPDVTPSKVSGPSKLSQKGSNLFGSDSDEEEDLFSKKPPPSEKVAKTPRQNQNETPVASSGGLFSSDEDSPLFSSLPQAQGPKNTKEDNEELPSNSKESGRKVPVGGVSIFGKAITSAIRRQQSSDEESSDNDEFKEPNTNSNKESMPPPSKPEDKSPQKTPMAIEKVPEKGSLFDSDDDDNLFGTLVKKPISVTKDKEETRPNTASLPPDSDVKSQEKSVVDNESPGLSWKNSNSKSRTGLFSDDDDDLFGIPSTSKKNDAVVPDNEALVTKEDPPKTTPAPPKAEESAASRPASIFSSPPEYPTPSKPVNISEPARTSHSLFSSPSDDDDDLFSSIPNPTQKTNPSSAFVREPPPLPPQDSTREVESFSKGPTQSDMLPTPNDGKPLKVYFGETPKEISSSLFSSPSDEEDIFASISSSENSQAAPSVPNKKETEPILEPQLDKRPNAPESNINTHNLEAEATERISVFPDDSPKDLTQSAKIDQSCSFSEEHARLSPEKSIGSGLVSKEDDIFASTEDDLFGATEKLPQPSSSSLKEGSSYSPLTPKVQLETNYKTSPMTSEDSAASAIPRLPEDGSGTSNEKPPDPLSVSSSQKEPDVPETEKPKESAFKPPVGGVALFSGKELGAQISKQKTLLKTPKNKSEQKIDDAPSSIIDTENEDDQDKGHIFDDNSDDIFSIGSGYSKSQHTRSVLHRQSPPLLPEETENNSELESDLFSTKQESPKAQGAENDLFSTKQESPKAEGAESDLFSTKQESPKAQETESYLFSSKQESPKTQGAETDLFSAKKESPKVLGAETDLFSTKQESPKAQEVVSQRIPTISGDEPDRALATISDQQNVKPNNSENEETKERKEVSPRKKPPVGGVSLFGAGAMGNNELFAKVLQRKSMLACESDSSEEDASTESTETTKPSVVPSIPLLLPTETGATLSKSVKTVSVVSPQSMYPPVFSPDRLESKPGGDESGVSFDDPATQSNVLQSMNKTRARGSLKRRPPSRAHRKKAASDPDPSDTPQKSASSDMPNNHGKYTINADSSKTEPSQPDERLQEPLMEKDQIEVPVSAEQEADSSTAIKTDTLSKISDSAEAALDPGGAVPEGKKKKVTAVDSKDVPEAPKRALNVSKTNTGSKVKSHSLFDGSDSDEDLFGEKKQKTGATNPSPSGSTRVPKRTGTKSKSHSLFGDDDDDDASIFSSKSQVTKTSAGAAKNTSVAKSKGNLKQSSEPFEDPLLGNLKK